MSSRTIIWALIVFVSIFSPVKASDSTYKPGELLVRFAPKADGKRLTVAECNNILASINGGSVKRSYKIVPGLVLIKLPENISVDDALPAFKSVTGILYAMPNYRAKVLCDIPDDTLFNGLWGMHNTGQEGGTVDADIDAPEAWDVITDSNVIVAVIDTGVDYTHPDLAANMWTDANGSYGYDFVNDDNDPMDDHFHGTHCAGTISAVGNNGVGVTGVCWNVKIMALKWIDYEGYGDIAGAIGCIDYAVSMNVKITSNSWWWPYGDYPPLREAIEAAEENGVLFIAAAGKYPQAPWFDNDITPVYPSSYDCDNIISVMATDRYDNKSDFSHYGATSVDLGAPGTDILSTFPTYMTSQMEYWGFSTDYETISGTSMATPHVAGACALVWNANTKLTHLQVKQAIMESVDELDSLDGLCVTGGRLNVYNAVSQWPLRLTKTDNVADGNGVRPYEPLLNNLLEYTIFYDACGISDTNVLLKDYLPAEVDYYQSVPQGVNDVNARTVTWQIGTMGSSSSGSYLLKVKVNNTAVAGGTIVNVCELAGDTFGRQAFERTPVACYRGDVLYVDADANSGGDGYSWPTAYKNLQDALDAAKSCECYASIWVAEGTYKPVTDTNIPNYQDYSIPLAEGLGLFGHFTGTENFADQRNFSDANNETVLDGQIGPNPSDAVYNVVKAKDIQEAILDGFTIRGGYNGSGVHLDNADVTVANCRIKNNTNYGIDVTHFSYPDIHNCTFINKSSADIRVYDHCWPEISFCIVDGNGTTTYGLEQTSYSVVGVQDSVFKNHTSCGITGSNGTLTVSNSAFLNAQSRGIKYSDSALTIDHTLIADNSNEGLYADLGCNLTLTNSVIRRNGCDGVELHDNLVTTITNNWIHNNGLAHLIYYGGAGISFTDQSSVPVVRNNTVYDNWTYGLQSSQYGADPNVRNCIIRGNDSGDFYRQNGSFNTVNYCCLQAPHAGTGNITSDPCFYDADNNDLHIRSESICKNAGDPNAPYGDETDIDGENRVYYGRIDMGADEYYWPQADYNTDGIVDFFDYGRFANNWLDVNSTISLDSDPNVDIDDLALFCEDWLWEAPWEYGWMLHMSGEGGGDMLMSESFLASDEGRGTGDELMIPDAKQSLAAMPQRIAKKAQRFYALNTFNAASARRLRTEAQAEIELSTIEDMIQWLDKLWESGELQEAMTYEKYLEFREAIQKAAEQ